MFYAFLGGSEGVEPPRIIGVTGEGEPPKIIPNSTRVHPEMITGKNLIYPGKYIYGT